MLLTISVLFLVAVAFAVTAVVVFGPRIKASRVRRMRIADDLPALAPFDPRDQDWTPGTWDSKPKAP